LFYRNVGIINRNMLIMGYYRHLSGEVQIENSEKVSGAVVIMQQPED